MGKPRVVKRMKIIQSRKCHPHGAAMIHDAFQMFLSHCNDVILRHKKKQAGIKTSISFIADVHINNDTFFPDCFFPFSTDASVPTAVVQADRVCRHIMLLPRLQRWPIFFLTIHNYRIMISFVLQRGAARQEIVFLRARQEVPHRLQLLGTMPRHFLISAGVQRVQGKNAQPQRI